MGGFCNREYETVFLLYFNSGMFEGTEGVSDLTEWPLVKQGCSGASGSCDSLGRLSGLQGCNYSKNPKEVLGMRSQAVWVSGLSVVHGVSHSPEYGQQTINWGKLLGKIMSPDKVKDESFFITFNVALKWSEVSLISAFLYVDNFSPWMTINVLLYPCN